ncbi:hypothetical protein [Rhodococcus sp. OK302]|uniref:hypothetical protein n=1 Tax=Rhodococcus sp. OK302 TaxID=1882769 RepID=UPI0011400844|nr:hypothetical protein [Rhodococcus sp. OK302]
MNRTPQFSMFARGTEETLRRIADRRRPRQHDPPTYHRVATTLVETGSTGDTVIDEDLAVFLPGASPHAGSHSSVDAKSPALQWNPFTDIPKSASLTN